MEFAEFAQGIGALGRSMVRFERPDRLARNLIVSAAIGPTLAGAVAGAAARYPHGQAIRAVGSEGRTDDTVTYGQLWQSAQAFARRLKADRVGEVSTVGIMAENSVGFVVALVACSIVGADVVMMNTGFGVPQLADVVQRERCGYLVTTPRLKQVCRDAAASIDGDAPVVIAVTPPFGDLGRSLTPSRRQAQMVILTSGTTGTPKGAHRGAASPVSAAGFLARVPVRSGDVVVIACPMFHAWGLTHAVMGLTMASTLVIDPDPSPARIGPIVEHQQATGLVLVPAVLQRLLLNDTGADTTSLRYIASSGSAIPPSTVAATLQRFGPVLYNTYGSTEVALATIATPSDLAANAASAGRLVPGVQVELLDDDGQNVTHTGRGRIFVDSGAAFEGYTGGGDKERVGSLVATGDVGHFDDDQLIIDGRSDDMIVSGGENVFPGEVEDLISALSEVAEVAVVGVVDDEFGQRLAAFVVLVDDATLTTSEVKSTVRANLARYKVPRDVTFVDELPRTESGKIRRSELELR